MNNEGTLEWSESQISLEGKLQLDEIVRTGAQKMLASALDAEVEDYIARHAWLRDAAGHRLVVRNGVKTEREVLSGAGALRIRQPRIHDKRSGHAFSSAILPPYLRRSPSLEKLIPCLYLKGISTGQFQEALAAILGPDAAGLSAKSIERLLKTWERDYEEWRDRDLSGKRYVYFWADGIYFNVRLDDERVCVLVVIGTLEDGTKELVGISMGYRESKLSWKDLLMRMKRNGLSDAPRLAVADGALGFWSALDEVFPETVEQRCWVHKTANILDKMPKSVQPAAKARIHEMYLAETKKNALKAYDDFLELYDAKYPAACSCLKKDKDALFNFHDFPAEHWRHIRTTNPIESTFATVRHRTRRTKGNGSGAATLSMVFQLIREAEKHWQRIHGYKLIPKVIRGVKFIDGMEEKAA